jgi:hypothetical protein
MFNITEPSPSGHAIFGSVIGAVGQFPKNDLMLPHGLPRFSEDRTFLVSALRIMFFSSVLADCCFVLDTSFFDSRTVSASFAFTRLVISRLSPVFGIFPPSANCQLSPELPVFILDF